MDATEIIDIPDTPDRVGRRKRDARDGCPLISRPEDSFLVGEEGLSTMAGRKDSGTQNQCQRRFIHHRRGVNISEPSGNGRSSVVSVHRHSPASENASLFRKVGNHSCKHDGRYHINSQLADNKKDVHLNCSSNPINHPEHSMGKFVLEGHRHRPQKTSQQSLLSEDNASKSKEDLLANSSVCHSEDLLKEKSSLKGKGKINGDAFTAFLSKNSQQKCSVPKDDGSEQKLSSHVSFPVRTGTSSKCSGRKRLVRNGCISPQNIAKAKQASERSSIGDTDFRRANANEMPKVDPSIVIDVDGERSSGRQSNQVKGKEKVTHPFSSGEHETRPRDLTKSLASGVDPQMNQSHRANTFKRQKKDDTPISSQDQDEEIVFIGSRSKPSSSGSHAEHTQRHPSAMDAVIEIDEHSPNIGGSNSRNDNDLAVRAQQVEADEMLARELQEELYHEMPQIGTTERDSHLAWMLQQEENVHPAPRSRNAVTHRISSSSQPRRQSRSQIFQNRHRRGAQAQANTRLTRLRTGMEHTSRLFPSEMDLERRIELLEALEAVVSNDISMVNQLLNPDREFTESDYDMLLALDENNHEHLGASNAQISNLPESIVQTSSSESCSICLEEPTIGETIRHLPCLHKFHKDCIDSWLRRKRSCPVCKSDIS